MNNHDIKIPDFISICARGGPSFHTKIANTKSAREVRMAQSNIALQKYIIKNCIVNKAQFNELNSFFRARLGRLYCFRFKDFADYEVKDELIAEYPNSETTFTFKKTYSNGDFKYSRDITKPIFSSLRVYINSNLIEVKINVEKVSFEILKPLERGEKLYINFEYDVNVRFCTDNFSYNCLNDGSFEIDNLEFLEVLCD